MTPESFDPFSYLVAGVQDLKEKNRGVTAVSHTHVVAKNSAIIFNTSVSLFVESSNPGVSTRITRLPSMVNSSASCTSSVHECRFSPTCRFE